MNGRVRYAEIAGLAVVLVVAEFLLGRLFPRGLLIDLPLILATYVGWNASPVRGAVAGMIFGLLQDSILGLGLGINGISKTAQGFLASYINRWTSAEGGFVRGVLLIGPAILDNLVIWGLCRIFAQNAFPDPGEIWLETLLTAAAGGLLFKFYDRIKFPERDFGHLD